MSTYSFHPYIEKYRDVFTAKEKEYDLRPGLLMAVAQAETGGFSRQDDLSALTSPAGAEGLMQFMPATAQRFKINPRDPVQAIEGAAKYFSALSKMFNNDTEKMVAAYNAGEGTVRDYTLGTNRTKKNPKLRSDTFPPFAENIAYRKKVLGILGTPPDQGGITQAADMAVSMLASPPELPKEPPQDAIIKKPLASIEPFAPRETAESGVFALAPYSPISAVYDRIRQQELEGQEESPDFFRVTSGQLQESLVGRGISKLSEEIAGDLDTNDTFRNWANTPEGRDSTAKMLSTYAGMDMKDGRFADALENLLESKNEVQRDIQLKHMRETLQNEQMLAKTYGISENISGLIAGQGVKGFRLTDVLADVTALALSPDILLPLGVTAKLAIGARNALYVRSAIQESAHAASVLSKSTAEFALKTAPLTNVLKVAVPASIIGETVALSRASEELSPAGTSEERLQASMGVAGVIGSIVGLGGSRGILKAGDVDAIEAALLQRNTHYKEFLKSKGLSDEDAVNLMAVSTKEITDNVLIEQVTQRIKGLEVAEDIPVNIKVTAQLEYLKALPRDSRVALIGQMEEVSADTGAFKDIVTAYKNDAIAKGDNAFYTSRTSQVIVQSTADAPATGGIGQAKKYDDEKANEIIQNVADELGISSSQMGNLSSAGLKPKGFLSELAAIQHWFYQFNSPIANALSVKMYGSTSGVIKEGERTLYAQSGILERAKNASNTIVFEARKAIRDSVVEWKKTTGGSEDDLNKALLRAQFNPLETTEPAVKKILETYREIFRELTKRAKDVGAISEETFREFSNNPDYLPRAFDVRELNAILKEKGLSDKELQAWVAQASINFVKKNMPLDADGNILTPFNARLDSNQDSINTAKLRVAALEEKLKEIDKNIKKERNKETKESLLDERVTLKENIKEEKAGIRSLQEDNHKTLSDIERYRRAVETKARAGARKYVQTVKEMYWGDIGEHEGTILSPEDFTEVMLRMRQEVIRRAKDSETDEVLDDVFSPETLEGLHKDLLKLMGATEDAKDAPLIGSLRHAAPLDLGTTITIQKPDGAEVSFSAMDIYGTTDFIGTMERNINSMIGTIEIARGTGITKITDIEKLAELAAKDIPMDADGTREGVKNEIKNLFRHALGQSIYRAGDQGATEKRVAGALGMLSSANYGATFGVGQIPEFINAIVARPDAFFKRFMWRGGNDQEALKTLANAYVNVDHPDHQAVSRTLRYYTNEAFQSLRYGSIYDARPESFKNKVGTEVFAAFARKANSFVFAKSNLHFMSRVITAQADAIRKTGLIDLQATAQSFVATKKEALTRIERDAPEIWAEYGNALSKGVLRDDTLLDILKAEFSQEYEKVAEDLGKTMFSKNKSQMLQADFGINPKLLPKVLNELAKSKNVEDISFNLKGLSDDVRVELFNGIERATKMLLLQGNQGSLPRFTYRHPWTHFGLTFLRFAFDAWENIGHAMFSNPQNAVIYGRLFGTVFAAMVAQEVLFLSKTALPMLATGHDLDSVTDERVKQLKINNTDKDDDGLMKNYLLSVLSRSAPLALPSKAYSILSGVIETLTPSFVRSSGLTSKGVLESTPTFGFLEGTAKAASSATSMITRGEPTQKEVKDVVRGIPFVNGNLVTSTVIRAFLFSDPVESLPEKPPKQ